MPANKPVVKATAQHNKVVAKKATMPATKKTEVPLKKGKPVAVPDKPAKKTVPAHTTKIPAKVAASSIKKGDIKPSASPVVIKGTKAKTAISPMVVAKKKEEPVKNITKQTVPAAPKKAAQTIVKSQTVATPAPKLKNPMPTKKKEESKPAKIVVPKTTAKTTVKYDPDFTKSVLDPNAPVEEPILPTMRYSDNDLVEFRELINRKLEGAKKELAYFQGIITRKDETGGDLDDSRYMTMEDGSLSMERENVSQMASRLHSFIDKLEKALMRIESKTYGICRETGKLIDKARLRAVPHATLSVEAKMGKSRN